MCHVDQENEFWPKRRKHILKVAIILEKGDTSCHLSFDMPILLPQQKCTCHLRNVLLVSPQNWRLLTWTHAPQFPFAFILFQSYRGTLYQKETEQKHTIVRERLLIVYEYSSFYTGYHLLSPHFSLIRFSIWWDATFLKQLDLHFFMV